MPTNKQLNELHARWIKRCHHPDLTKREKKLIARFCTDLAKTINADVPIKDCPKFPMFWNKYNKKVNKPSTAKLWMKLTEAEKDAAMGKKLDIYLQNTPDKTFRVHPDKWIRNRKWEDEILIMIHDKKKPWQQPDNPTTTYTTAGNYARRKKSNENGASVHEGTTRTGEGINFKDNWQEP